MFNRNPGSRKKSHYPQETAKMTSFDDHNREARRKEKLEGLMPGPDAEEPAEESSGDVKIPEGLLRDDGYVGRGTLAFENVQGV